MTTPRKPPEKPNVGPPVPTLPEPLSDEELLYPGEKPPSQPRRKVEP